MHNNENNSFGRIIPIIYLFLLTTFKAFRLGELKLPEDKIRQLYSLVQIK